MKRTATWSAALFESLENRQLMSAAPSAGLHVNAEPPTGPELASSVLAKPTELKAAKAARGVSLHWTDKATNETGYAIFRVSGHTISYVGSVDANVTNYTDAGATVGLNQYVVRAFNAAGKSGGSNVASVTLERLLAPNRLRTQAMSTTSIKVTWEGDTGASCGYIIERKPTGHDGWVVVGTATARCYTDKNLTAGTKYDYRITAVGADGSRTTSAVVIGMTKATDKGDATRK